MAEDKFFVLGCSRSGTTLLASYLNSHPRIGLFPETWWLATAHHLGLSKIESSWQLRIFLFEVSKHVEANQSGKLIHLIEEFEKTHADFRGDYSALLRLFADFVKSKTGVDRFGEKTPAHSTYSREINQSFPDFKRIILHRDPRDVACSHFNAWYPNKSLGDLFQILTALKMYHYHLLALDGDIVELSFERLTTAPSETLTEACHFLDVPFDPEMLRRTHLTARAEGLHRNIGGPLTPNVGNFERELDARYIRIIEAVMAPEMERLGYTPSINAAVPIPSEFAISEAEWAELSNEEGVGKLSRNWEPRRWQVARSSIGYLYDRFFG